MTNRLSSGNKQSLLPAYTLVNDIGAATGPILGFMVPETMMFLLSALILGTLAAYWRFGRVDEYLAQNRSY